LIERIGSRAVRTSAIQHANEREDGEHRQTRGGGQRDSAHSADEGEAYKEVLSPYTIGRQTHQDRGEGRTGQSSSDNKPDE